MNNFKKTLITVSVAAAVIFASCKKETPEDPPISTPPTPSVPSAVQLKAFFQDNRENMKQNFTIDVASPVLITGAQGTKIQFQPNSFETQGGGAVTGNVKVDLIEIYDKGNMVLANSQTMANTYSGGIEPIVSGGEFFIEVTQNGTPLKLKPYNSYTLEAPAPNGTVPQMTLFYGDESRGSDTLVWDLADSARFNANQNTSYFAFIDSLRWINCDYFYSNPNPKVNLSATIPSGFTNQTCKVLISFDGLNAVTSFYNFSAGVYSSDPPYKLPTGLGVHLIAISVINGVTHASITPGTIVSGVNVTINPLVATTPAQLAIDVNNLP